MCRDSAGGRIDFVAGRGSLGLTAYEVRHWSQMEVSDAMAFGPSIPSMGMPRAPVAGICVPLPPTSCYCRSSECLLPLLLRPSAELHVTAGL
jgi:hypothetical protein